MRCDADIIETGKCAMDEEWWICGPCSRDSEVDMLRDGAQAAEFVVATYEGGGFQ